jgi:hypothetical protein
MEVSARKQTADVFPFFVSVGCGILDFAEAIFTDGL